MRVMTLNIWNYEPGWETRRNAIVRIIEEEHPDVIALQEARRDFRFDRGQGQGEQIARMTDYTATSAVAQVYLPFPLVAEGLSILTREPPLNSGTYPFTLHPHRRADENHRICLSVAVEWAGQVVHVFDTHFSLDLAARRANAKELVGVVERESVTAPAVVMGDLNAEPGAAEIKYLTGEAGFRDVWPAAQEREPGYTYASFNPVRRIDYILVRNFPLRPVVARLVGTQAIDGIFPSDHLGILADLPLP